MARDMACARTPRSDVDPVEEGDGLLESFLVPWLVNQDVPAPGAVLILLDLGGGLVAELAGPVRINHGVSVTVEGHKGQSDALEVPHDVGGRAKVLARQSHARLT